VIRNAVIHLHNEQPLLADLLAAPRPGDAGLVCTNLRMLDGRQPLFVASSDATFYFPYLHVRFLEIPRVSLGTAEADPDDATLAGSPEGRAGQAAGDDGGELEIDEDFLRRIREA